MKNKQTDTYELRGVSSSKEDVHNAIKNLSKGLYKDTFAKIVPDSLTGDERFCLISHADGAGTKALAAYLCYKQTGDLSVFRGIAQDSIVMNLDDMIACGATGPFTYAQIINRNKNLIKQEIIDEVINGAQEFFDRMKQFGIDITFTGGETADLGDTVRTLTVDGVMTARMRRDDIVHIDIKPGDYIVGLASSGQSAYEDSLNSGIGSNGLTDARHDLLENEFALIYPESYDPRTPEDLVYRGRFNFKSVGVNAFKDLLLSPTRTYAPIVRDVLSRETRKDISGIIHCSGGGQTKVLNFVDKIRIEKDNMFPVPDIFKLIQKESGKDTAGMLSTYNMGSRMEIYVRNEKTANRVMFLASSYGVDSKIVGRCFEKNDGTEVACTLPGRERVVISQKSK
ncbi:MAG: hypothetical protein RL641_847 [Candidatus Parcubacteria bacterium]|jgi:phosphoribosylformylglycinamidine cyclo-ligase